MLKIPSEPPAPPSHSRDTVPEGRSCFLQGFGWDLPRAPEQCRLGQESALSRLGEVPGAAAPSALIQCHASAALSSGGAGNCSSASSILWESRGTDVLTAPFVPAERLCPNLLLSPLPGPCCPCSVSSLGREERVLPGKSWRNPVGEHSWLGEPHPQPHPPLSWYFPLPEPRCQLPAAVSWLEGKEDCHCPSLQAGIPWF